MSAVSAASRRFDEVDALIWLVWAVVVVPRTVQTIAAPKPRLDVGQATGFVPTVALLNLGFQLALLGFCAVVVLGRLTRLPERGRLAMVAMLLPWVYLVVRDSFLQQSPQLVALYYPAIVLAVWVLQPGVERLRTLGHLIVATAVLSMALALLLPTRGILVSVAGETVTPDKQLLPIGLLIGMFTSGNNLGAMLAIAAPLAVLIRRPWRSIFLLVMAAALVWTSSRSSLFAFAAAVGVAVAVSAVPRLVRGAVASVGLLVATATVLLPLGDFDDGSFTNRGFVWRRSLEVWESNPLFGSGSDWYAQAAGSSEQIVGTAFHAHNQMVQMLVTGGVVLVVLVTVVLVVAARKATVWAVHADQPAPVAFLVALLISSSLEVSFGVVDRSFLIAAVTLPLAVLVLGPTPRRSDPRGRRPRPVENRLVLTQWRSGQLSVTP